MSKIIDFNQAKNLKLNHNKEDNGLSSLLDAIAPKNESGNRMMSVVVDESSPIDNIIAETVHYAKKRADRMAAEYNKK